MNALVLNELGFGNGVLALPVLDALANRVCRGTVWHVENPFLAYGDLAARLRVRSVPARWMRAEPSDHEAILNFVERERIDLVVSLRNEDYALPFNAGYAPLRARLQRRVAVWDLFDRPDETRHRYIVDQWAWLFAQHGLCLDVDVARPLLEALAGDAASAAEGVAIVAAGSRGDKRVAPRVVAAAARSLLERGQRVVVIGGTSAAEQSELESLRRLIGDERVECSAPSSIGGLLGVLRSVRAVICNDTFAMHCAVAMQVPTVGLFATTRRVVWGPPDSDRFRGLSAAPCTACSWMPVQGCCYASARCPSVPNEGFDARSIVRRLDELLTSRPA